MTDRYFRKLLLSLTGLAVVCSSAAFAGDLASALKEQLQTSKYVYISSQRKDGSFGQPAEIWFMYHQGAVWVASPPTTWRVRRIKAGRTAAKIAIGKVGGPSFEATGEIIKNDPVVSKAMFEIYAKKYPDRWPSYEAKFHEGLANGSRVLIKYTPKG